jgi:dTDP-glucose pyrophosphorylase
LAETLQGQKSMWGIIPAAGAGTRIQPLAFSKELLPVGSRLVDGMERPKAVSEYIVERMLRAGVDKLCFVISSNKHDIVRYYGNQVGNAAVCYVVQPEPLGLCDALFRPAPFIARDEQVLVGLPDTIWFPEDGYRALETYREKLSFLLFPVARPERFDAVTSTDDEKVQRVQVKQSNPDTHWVWGGFRMPGAAFSALHALWLERQCCDEQVGTLVNEYIARGADVRAVKAGSAYFDVGTLEGLREATKQLEGRVPSELQSAILAG